MTLAENNHLVKLLFPNRSDPSFRIRIGAKCLKRGVSNLNAFRFEDGMNRSPYLPLLSQTDE